MFPLPPWLRQRLLPRVSIAFVAKTAPLSRDPTAAVAKDTAFPCGAIRSLEGGGFAGDAVTDSADTSLRSSVLLSSVLLSSPVLSPPRFLRPLTLLPPLSSSLLLSLSLIYFPLLSSLLAHADAPPSCLFLSLCCLLPTGAGGTEALAARVAAPRAAPPCPARPAHIANTAKSLPWHLHLNGHLWRGPRRKHGTQLAGGSRSWCPFGQWHSKAEVVPAVIDST